MKCPYIFIFDIDNAIIGNVYYIVNEYNINKNIIDTNDNIKPMKLDFTDDMRNGLLRPRFIDFINFCKKKYKKCEFYVYTASSYEWVHNGLVESIEKVANIKFNKPYFTREDTIPFKGKSIKIIVDHIKNKYKLKDDINNKIVFIDDIENNTTTYKNRQIKCPKYGNIIYRDVYQNLTNLYGEKIIKTKNIENIFVNNCNLPYYNEKSDNILLKNKDYFDLLNITNKKYAELYNIKYKDDMFFATLIKNLNNLSNKNIAKINKLFD